MDNSIKLTKMSCKNLWSIKKTILIMTIIYMLLAICNDVILNMLFGFIVYINIHQTLAYEEGYGIDTLISYLPVKGKEYVLSRYLFSVINIVFSIVIFTFCFYVSNLKATSDATNLPYIPMLVLCMLPSVLMLSISLPILIKTGLKKGRVIVMIIMMSAMFIPGIFVEEFMIGASKISASINLETFGIVIAILASVLILGLSYFISCALYKEKELLNS